MLPFFLSPVSLYAIYVRRCFAASGLSQQTLQLDNETTLHFWGPNPKFSQATQKKPSLVLIHGFGPVAISSPPRFNVYVPDLVFFGDSTTTSAERSEVFQAASVAKLMEKAGVERFSVIGTSYGGFVAYHVARMWPERVEKVVIASSGVNMRRGDNEKLLRRAKLEKIEHLMLPATAVQLQTLIGLAMSRRVDVIPRFLLNDFVQKLYSDKRKEKMELLKGLTLGRDDTLNLSPLPNKASWTQNKTGSDKEHIASMAYDMS
ncbi:hypothetical protein GBA52_028342 [Prunus armeniaca]|nr:hypothetical protein GBA52_028342 [Prunus armeniaca]